jgi:hypothetical protein
MPNPMFNFNVLRFFVLHGTIFYYRPTYNLAGFDLTTHSSNLLAGGGNDTARPSRQGPFHFVF